MVKKVQTAKKEKEQNETLQEQKKLSKAGEWKRAHPNGILEIHDMRAVMK